MRWMVITLAVLLGGCSKGKEAEDRYRIVARAGDAPATCRAANEVASAYLIDKNEDAYKRWAREAEGDCAVARLQSLRD